MLLPTIWYNLECSYWFPGQSFFFIDFLNIRPPQYSPPPLESMNCNEEREQQNRAHSTHSADNSQYEEPNLASSSIAANFSGLFLLKYSVIIFHFATYPFIDCNSEASPLIFPRSRHSTGQPPPGLGASSQNEYEVALSSRVFVEHRDSTLSHTIIAFQLSSANSRHCPYQMPNEPMWATNAKGNRGRIMVNCLPGNPLFCTLSISFYIKNNWLYLKHFLHLYFELFYLLKLNIFLSFLLDIGVFCFPSISFIDYSVWIPCDNNNRIKSNRCATVWKWMFIIDSLYTHICWHTRSVGSLGCLLSHTSEH